MAPLPKRVIRGTRPSKHRMHEEKREDGDHNHAPWLAPHVRHGIQGDLSAKCRRLIASRLGDECVRRLMTGRGEEKRDIPDESENEKFGSEIRQEDRPFRLLSSSRLEVVTRLCKRLSSARFFYIGACAGNA